MFFVHLEHAPNLGTSRKWIMLQHLMSNSRYQGGTVLLALVSPQPHMSFEFWELLNCADSLVL